MRNYHFRHAGRRQTERAYTITIAGNKVFLRVQSERSERLRELRAQALRRRRGLYFIDRCGGVLFPADLITIAAYEAALRVQSERSERLRELRAQALRRRRSRCAAKPIGVLPEVLP